jgi:hypothetical protein
MKKESLLVKPWAPKDRRFVRYKRKKWLIKDLLESLAQQVKELEANQCEPTTKCIFIGREKLIEKANYKDLPHEHPEGFYG